ncbi:MAG: methyltransferase domain-containing protein [Syntrophorhabdus sp.]|nr:methyltransferase domain-containing protein [Syntrophorhabdus sp.]
MFAELEEINSRPEPFEFYTARDLWTDGHTSRQMLSLHLDPGVNAASRNQTFIERSVEWIADHFALTAGMKVADFGCGPGLYTTRLARKGLRVTGIDFSPRSIAYAKEAAVGGLSVDYINEDYLDFETDERFDLVMMIMCDYCALSPVQRRRMLAKFGKILEPGGHVLLDAYSLKAFESRKETATYEPDLPGGFWSAEKYCEFLNVFKYETEKVVLDKYTIVEPHRTRTIYNWLQYFSPETLKREFAECGFETESLFSDVAGTPFDSESSEFAIVARRSPGTRVDRVSRSA